MRSLPTRLSGPRLIEPTVHGDARGFFAETFRAAALAELGADEDWVQDNHSRSRRGVARGMHFQPGQAKLVRCARGAITDVLVDLRRGSPSFGEWEPYELDDQTLRVLYAPDGFAHGFCVTSEVADVTYKCSAYYDPERERGFRIDDPDVAIRWPTVSDPIRSDRDLSAPRLAELVDELPYVFEG